MKHGYTRSEEMTVVRTIHRVRLWKGRSVASIIADLQQVTENIHLTDIEDEDNDVTLVFLQERKKPPENTNDRT